MIIDNILYYHIIKLTLNIKNNLITKIIIILL